MPEPEETRDERIARIRGEFASRVVEKYEPFMDLATFILNDVITWGIDNSVPVMHLQHYPREGSSYDVGLTVFDNARFWAGTMAETSFADFPERD